MKVLLVLDHAPDYREAFLRQLGEHVELTVVAQPCESAGLAPPSQRLNYKYIELPVTTMWGLVWQHGLIRVLHSDKWDIVCVGLNLRHVARLLGFVFAKSCLRSRWVWWGHIFGRNRSRILDRIRGILLRAAAGCMTHNEPDALSVMNRYRVRAVSFNNSEVCRNEFREGKYNLCHEELRLLFVGRYHPRKRLDRLVKLAQHDSRIQVRLVGPGMDELSVPDSLRREGRIQVFGRTVGPDLDKHFDWADLVVCPGAVGLLVMNAARHGKPIVLDAHTEHGPEYWLAKQAGQPFIPFDDIPTVISFLEEIRNREDVLRRWGQALQDIAREQYTVEHMVDVHLKEFRRIHHLYCVPDASESASAP